MLQEKAGAVAGKIWTALSEKNGQTVKEIKKAAKISTDKDFYMGLGWLLREDKVSTIEADKDIIVSLK